MEPALPATQSSATHSHFIMFVSFKTHILFQRWPYPCKPHRLPMPIVDFVQLRFFRMKDPCDDCGSL